MKLKNKNILIFGLGRSGNSCLKYLLKQNLSVFVFDDNKEILKNYKKNNINILDDENLDVLDLVILSPGVSKQNETLRKIMDKKIAIISELEFAYVLFRSQNLIAITGTNGKTTTTELISEMLSREKKVFKCGNIGIPAIDMVDKATKDDYVVAEVSSFQLEDIISFKPHIAVITNLAGDHLDRYSNLQEYWETKLKIYKNQEKNDYLVSNYEISPFLNNLKCKIFLFSTEVEVVGAFVKNSKIYFKENEFSEPIFVLDESDIHLKGKHNLENILATICVGFISNIKLEKIRETLKSFNAIEHRFEKITTIKGIEFVNDSKATNINATLSAVLDLKCEVHLLLGGSDKGEDFNTLFECLPKNVSVYLFGSTTNKMVNSCLSVGFKKFKICRNMRDGLEKAFSFAKRGELILLSPACASFDEFKNYEERGKLFKEWVFNLNEKE